MATATIVCVDCGKKTKRTGCNQKRCPKCRRSNHLRKCKDRWHRTYEKKGYDQAGPKNNHWRGGSSPQYYQKVARDTHGEACLRCGEPAVLVHHKDENRKNSDPSNLEPLCKRCHQVYVHNCTSNLPQYSSKG